MSRLLTQPNSLKNTKFDIDKECIKYKGKHYNFNDIIHLARHRQQIKTTYVAVGTDKESEISIAIQIRGGTDIIISEQGTMLHQSNINNVEKIEYYYELLREKTFEQRIQPYLNDIERSGVFQWSGWQISVVDRTFTLLKTSTSYDVNSLIFKKRYGFIIIEPKEPTLIVKAMRFFVGSNQPIGLNTFVDEDVLLSLLKSYFRIYWI